VDDADGDSSLCWVTAPGIQVDEQTRGSVEAYMVANGISAADVLPSKMPLSMVWSMGCHIDPTAHRADSARPGDTGLHAFVAPVQVVDALSGNQASMDLATFVTMAREVRRRVDGPHELLIAPTLTAHSRNPFFDARTLEVKLGGSVSAVAFGIPIATILMLIGPFVAPWMGSLALLLHLTQQALAVRNTGFQVRWSWIQGLARPAVDLFHWLVLLRGHRVGRQKIDELRPVYSSLMAHGTADFFESPRTQCPICAGDDIVNLFSLPDLYQGKPGQFTVSRCKSCGSCFQNPRLSLEGLHFYYRDFYDGIGEDSLDTVFGATKDLYAARIEMVREQGVPGSWLDVGCGHGHLFAHVRNAMPDTTLSGLDMGDGVDIALARGWIDEGHKGLFPECAEALSGRFNVVSMCHYLEHTLDIPTELKSAHKVLADDGLLLIEVPDPQSVFARVLGRWWMPWFQPQHIQFVTTVGMAKLLRNSGFEPIKWHTGKAHTANDFILSFSGMVRRFAPRLDVPWRPQPTMLRRISNAVIWIPGALFIALGGALDQLLKPMGSRLHHTSQYRVLARKK
jgi:ubiquinone/menaquinone biosynthesis C-methylase UbiE